MNTIHCPHCGTANRAGSNFCNRCGTELRASTTNNLSDVAQSSAAQTAVAEFPDAPEGSMFSSPEDSQNTDLPDDAATSLPAGAEEPWLADALPATERPFMSVDEFAQNAIDDDVAEMPPLALSGRLITGIQGLLEPLRISSEFDERDNGGATTVGATDAAPRHLAPMVDLEVDQLRRLRGFMTQDPTLLNPPPLLLARQWPALRLPWLFLLLGLLVGIPIFMLFGRPVGRVQQWPGVAEAHTLIDKLAPNASVLILWAYDPATADEMDLVALPLAAHLLDRQSQPIVVSLLPNGPASARRLFGRASADLPDNQTQPDRTREIDGIFLPGGAVALPLLAQNLRAAVVGQTVNPSPALTNALAQRPALTIVVAATAEDVQQWLELGQPLQQTPVVAFTSAGADPILRPYLESGQLSGLVSGFDGAVAYQQLRTQPLSRGEETVYRRQLVFQNWGHLAFLLVIVLGNLAALVATRS